MAITTGILTGGTNVHQTTSEEANAWATDFISEGIVGTPGSTNGLAPTTGSWSINAQGTPDMTVAVGSGTAYVTGTPSSQSSQTFRVKNSASSNVTISANSSGSTKYDWLYIKLDATKLNTPNSAADDVATLVTSRSSSAASDDGTPPTYGYPIAVITVANGATSITNSNIRDLRTQSTISSASSGASNDWYSTGLSPNTVTANGNRSYDLVFNSTDLTTYISNGMRLKLPRTVTPPTQCTDLESSSSQYYSKSSPAGTTFTDDFVVSAWIKLESYTAGKIASRFNNTSGWQFGVESNGTLSVFGYKASSSNYSGITSYQSVPLGKWVHVAAQLDMSAFTATTTTSYIMIDGVDVPATVSRGGTNPTDLTQAGNLEIGAANGGNTPFDGKLAQVAIYSAKVTQATIKASMNQTLTGSETSLVSAYTFNGASGINDLSANANNLTANGGALATNTDSPMNATEYGIVMANSFSTNTTLTVQVPEGYSLPTTGGIGTVSYSTQKIPYGFPGQRGKWTILGLHTTSDATTSNASYGAFMSGGWQLVVPPGAWKVGYTIPGAYNVTATTIYFGFSPSALTGLTHTQGAAVYNSIVTRIVSPSAAAVATTLSNSIEDAFSTPQTFIMYTMGSTTSAGADGSASINVTFAECAYL